MLAFSNALATVLKNKHWKIMSLIQNFYDVKKMKKKNRHIPKNFFVKMACKEMYLSGFVIKTNIKYHKNKRIVR